MAEDTKLYAKLKKLFSSGPIVRNVGGRKLKVADTDNLQATLSNSMRERYARIHSSLGGYGSSANTSYSMNAAYQSQRILLFRDYDLMDCDSIISSVLDIYAEESTLRNEYNSIATIECEDKEIKAILENLYYDILNIEFNLTMWIRSLCKYGDFFLFLEIAPEYGIQNVLPLSVYDTVRLEGQDSNNPHYVFFETLGASGQKQRLENYEVAHFRILGDSNFLPYGRSMLEGARRVFRQLILMEDAMLIHRIMRAPEKRLFKIDVGNLPPAEIDNYMKQLIANTKKVPFVDPNTGEYNLRFNLQNVLEDFYLPVRGRDSGTDIQNLGGLEYSSIEDVEYLKGRMLAALKVPKAFIGYDESLGGKLTLSAEDVRFARTIEKVQRHVQSELYKIGIVHLYSQGFKDEELINWSIKLSTSSTIAEQEKINLWKEKLTLARDILDTKVLSTDWIYTNLFNFSEETFDQEREKILQDVKRTFRQTQIEQGNSDPVKFGYPQDKPPAPMESPMEEGQDSDSTSEPQQEGKRTGRPYKGSTYGQRSNSLTGWDPLGAKERYHVIGQKEKRKHDSKYPLSLETLLQNIPKSSRLLQELTEDDEEPSILNEENLENLSD